MKPLSSSDKTNLKHKTQGTCPFSITKNHHLLTIALRSPNAPAPKKTSRHLKLRTQPARKDFTLRTLLVYGRENETKKFLLLVKLILLWISNSEKVGSQMKLLLQFKRQKILKNPNSAGILNYASNKFGGACQN